jgi:hypothetical protein
MRQWLIRLDCGAMRCRFCYTASTCTKAASQLTCGQPPSPSPSSSLPLAVSETGTALSAPEHLSTCLVACSLGALVGPLASRSPVPRAEQELAVAANQHPLASPEHTREQRTRTRNNVVVLRSQIMGKSRRQNTGIAQCTTPNWEVGADPLASIEQGRVD